MTNLLTIYDLFKSCTAVTTDSRNCPAGSMFFALHGDNFNGNQFAAKALEAQASYVVVDDPKYFVEGNPHYLRVPDSLDALQQLARMHRRRLEPKVIAITGTNGKTTTKELIAAVLSKRYRVLATQGNLNNNIGVPLTLLRLTRQDEYAVIEMGASHPGDIEELVNIVEPDYGIITNVAKAHLEGFGSFEGVMKTKGELYDYLRRGKHRNVFVNQDNEYLKKMSEGMRRITYGEHPMYNVSGKITGNGPFFSFSWMEAGDGTPHQVQTKLVGNYNFTNALAAVAVGCTFRVDEDDISDAIASYEPRNNRSQFMKTADNTLVIDAYNANPTSMTEALKNFAGMDGKPKMVILGDMRELGEESEAEHQKIIDYLNKANFDRTILVGKNFNVLQHPFEHYANVDEVKAQFTKEKPKGYTVLIKGSNSLKLFEVPGWL